MLQKMVNLHKNTKLIRTKLSQNHILSLCKFWINLQLLLLRTWMMQPAMPLHARIALQRERTNQGAVFYSQSMHTSDYITNA